MPATEQVNDRINSNTFKITLKKPSNNLYPFMDTFRWSIRSKKTITVYNNFVNDSETILNSCHGDFYNITKVCHGCKRNVLTNSKRKPCKGGDFPPSD